MRGVREPTTTIVSLSSGTVSSCEVELDAVARGDRDRLLLDLEARDLGANLHRAGLGLEHVVPLVVGRRRESVPSIVTVAPASGASRSGASTMPVILPVVAGGGASSVPPSPSAGAAAVPLAFSVALRGLRDGASTCGCQRHDHHA